MPDKITPKNKSALKVTGNHIGVLKKRQSVRELCNMGVSTFSFLNYFNLYPNAHGLGYCYLRAISAFRSLKEH